MNWKEKFDSIHCGELIGASEEELLLFVKNCSHQLNEKEKIEFPEQYLHFLKFCNTGINTIKGNRELQFFTTKDLIEYNLDYKIKEYLVGAVSIAMDGNGHHIFFDFKKNDGKWYGIHSSDLDCDEVRLIADDLIQLCEETTRIDEIMWK